MKILILDCREDAKYLTKHFLKNKHEASIVSRYKYRKIDLSERYMML